MKLIIPLIIAFLAGYAFSAETNQMSVSNLKDMTPAQRKEFHDKRINERFGGYINVRGTPSGQIVILNLQDAVDESNFDIGKQRSSYHELTQLTKVIKGTYDKRKSILLQMNDLKKQHKADFLMVIVKDANLPPSLVAIESRWAIMNIAALEEGAANQEVVRLRSRTEFSRVYALLCGGYGSQFKSPIMNCITKISDLDRCLPELPVDVGMKMVAYLQLCGVNLPRRTTYKKACEQGWAPAPTNEIQKAIWDKVHQLPKKPMKIEFDPKKGR